MKKKRRDSSGGTPGLGTLSARWRWGILLLILAFGVGLRLYDLAADPPLGMTWSHAPYTDGARIVEGARSKVLWDVWEMDREGPVVLYYPLSSLLAYAVFGAFGLGLWQANLTGVIPGIASLILILLVGLRKGWWVALVATLLAASSYFWVVYNRLPMCESLMIALMLAVPLLLIREPLRWWHSGLAGLALSAAAFFVKFHALVLLPVAVVWLVLFRDDPEESVGGIGRWRHAGGFLAGLLLGVGIWLLAIVLPRPGVMGDFLQHNLIAQYDAGQTGAGGGVLGFLEERLMGLVGLGTNVSFFGRMPGVGLLALLAALRFASHWKQRRGRRHWVESFSGLWLLGGIAALAVLDYRPLRYHLQLIPPMVILASMALVRLVEPPEPPSETPTRGRGWWILLFGVFISEQVLIEVPVYMGRHSAGSKAFLSAFGLDPRATFAGLARFVGSPWTVLVVAAAVSAAAVGLVRWIERRRRARGAAAAPLGARVGLASILVGLCLVMDVGQYRSAVAGARHSLRDTSRDLGQIVGGGGFVVGTTATSLTLENSLRSLPAYGRIAKQEQAEQFGRYPITHFLLREGVLFDFLSEHFAESLEGAVFLRRYVIGSSESSLYRAEGWPGRPAYEPTAYERAMEAFRREDWEGAVRDLQSFLELHPENAGAVFWLGVCIEKQDRPEEALRMMERAVSMQPEDLALLTDLGAAYARAGRAMEAYAAWRRVLSVNPYDARARGYIQTLNRMLREGG